MPDTPLFDHEDITPSGGPVNCLGMTFENDQARREYFTQLLQAKLKDPEFRKIEGFPLGEDADIFALSDPPYYTACPNPWIGDFIKQWEAEKQELRGDAPEGEYHREPFAADVSEGKNDPIYNAHSYHTKVPHKAIMRYILHYTEPGDIVFDGFCGTGMTGVAAQMCGDQKTVESLGYKVQPDGVILDEEGQPCSKLGARRAVLNDLSPAATFIAYNYNTPVDIHAFEREAKRILAEVEKECGWMYETKHSDGATGKINYTVWSDVFVCSDCLREVIFWEVAVDKTAGKVLDEFPCPHCNSSLTKRNMERAWVTHYDSALGETISQVKQTPVLINYTVNGKRAEKTPDADDLELIETIEKKDIPYWFPTDRMMYGGETRRNDPIGITHIHHFYMKRNLWVLAALLAKSNISIQKKLCRFLFQQWAIGFSILNRYSPTHFSQNNRNLSGTLYIGSQISEVSPSYAFTEKLKRLSKSFGFARLSPSCISQQDASNFSYQKNDSVDYLFIDPPFGANLNYSELNFLWESWLKVWTNNKSEAIENKTQGKGPDEYRHLMTACFKEAYRVLKPGRWMTVEFSNTKASVWNNIQTALADAGFIVANVSVLDKQQGSFKAVTTPTAVKQDLIISAYKPNGGFEERFAREVETEQGVWDFVRTHLGYLPVTKRQGTDLLVIPERDPRILFDQMIAYYVRKGHLVPLSSQEFQAGLAERFIQRDGMYFLSEQAAEYDRKRMTATGAPQLQLFVSDEGTAIQWLRQQLKEKPQTFQELQPKFMQELAGWSKYEKPLELSVLLEQNFLCYDGAGEVPSQIHSYLSTDYHSLRNLAKDDPELVSKAQNRWYVPDSNKEIDIEKIRHRTLMREFNNYIEIKGKIKLARKEALKAGFKECWAKGDYAIIVNLAQRLADDIIQEDPALLMYYDNALMRTEG